MYIYPFKNRRIKFTNFGNCIEYPRLKPFNKNRRTKFTNVGVTQDLNQFVRIGGKSL